MVMRKQRKTKSHLVRTSKFYALHFIRAVFITCTLQLRGLKHALSS